MNYRDADDQLFEIIQTAGTRMFHSVRTTAFPDSYRAMFGFCAKAGWLKTAIFDMVDSENPYALKALFRCYCEHYLKFMYVWLRFLQERADTVGTEYFSYCGAIELREYAAAVAMADALVGQRSVSDLQRAITSLYPKASKLTTEELRAASARFRYRAIPRFLSREMPVAFSGDRPFLPTVVPSYALLSSFVHGGPWSDYEMGALGPDAALAQCRKDAELVFLMSASMLMFTGMAVSRELPEHAVVAAEVRRVMDTFKASAQPDEA